MYIIILFIALCFNCCTTQYFPSYNNRINSRRVYWTLGNVNTLYRVSYTIYSQPVISDTILANKKTIKKLLYKSIHEWTKHINIRFIYTRHKNKANVIIKTEKLNHFIVGNADLPLPYGFVQTYTINENICCKNINELKNNMLHELGHILGLHHNKNIYSIMYETMSLATNNGKLTKYDIENVIKLYGKKNKKYKLFF